MTGRGEWCVAEAVPTSGLPGAVTVTRYVSRHRTYDAAQRAIRRYYAAETRTLHRDRAARGLPKWGADWPATPRYDPTFRVVRSCPK